MMQRPRSRPSRFAVIASLLAVGGLLIAGLTLPPMTGGQAGQTFASEVTEPRLFFLNIQGQVLSAAVDGSDLRVLVDNLDTSALEFNLTGTARGVDRNGDSKMDEIQTGVWTGEVKYSGSPAPLSTAKFHGSKAI